MGKVLKNSVSSIVRVILVTPIFFILIPYTISKIGTEGYGVWALTGIISSYQSFVNMGLTGALIRYVAISNVNQDKSALSEYLGTSFWAYFLLSVVVGIVIFIFQDFIITRILNIKIDITTSRILLISTFIASAINMISGLFKSTIDGLQRMDVSNLILLLQVVISAVGTFVFLEIGYGLLGLAYNLVITSILSLLGNVYSAKVISGFNFRGFVFKISRLKEMFSYSVNLQLGSIVRAGIEPMNKVLLSHFFSMEHVAYYDIAWKFSVKLGGLVNAALTPILPASTEIYEKHGVEKLELFRKKVSVYILSFITPLYVIILVVLSAFVALWIGYSNNEIVISIVIFLIASFISSITIPGYFILNGSGFANDTFKVQLFGTVCNVIVIFLGIKLIGFYGFAIGFFVAQVLNFFMTYKFYSNRILNEKGVYKVFRFPRLLLSNLAIAILGFIIVNVFMVDTYWELVLVASLLLVVYLALLRHAKVISAEDIPNVGFLKMFK